MSSDSNIALTDDYRQSVSPFVQAPSSGSVSPSLPSLMVNADVNTHVSNTINNNHANSSLLNMTPNASSSGLASRNPTRLPSNVHGGYCGGYEDNAFENTAYLSSGGKTLASGHGNIIPSNHNSNTHHNIGIQRNGSDLNLNDNVNIYSDDYGHKYNVNSVDLINTPYSNGVSAPIAKSKEHSSVRRAPKTAMESIPLDADEKAVAEFLAILEEHRHDCEQNSMYIEAEITKKRLEELRAHEDKRRREALKSRHFAERLDVEEAHMLEFEAFNQAWNKKMDLYDTRTQVLLQEMKERHQEELAEWQNQMQSRFLLRPKLSKEVLNLRKIEQNLAKAKNYMEAHKVKLRADTKEKWELEDLKKDWKQKVEAQQSKFIIQQQQELDAFKQRIEAGRFKQQRVRQQELERTMQRYENVKQDLDRQQRMEANRSSTIESSGVAMVPHLRRGGVPVLREKNGTSDDNVNDVYGATEFANQLNSNSNYHNGITGGNGSIGSQTHHPNVKSISSTKLNRSHKVNNVPLAAAAYAQGQTQSNVYMQSVVENLPQVSHGIVSNNNNKVKSQSPSTLGNGTSVSGSRKPGVRELVANSHAQSLIEI
jgi:hypothetical protein